MNIGAIHVDGEAASGTNAGGGSGGTIFIKARSFEGHGEVTANGGQGSGSGGGGAGGRIRADIQDE